MRVYKLTDENMQTYGHYQWKIGEWKSTSGEGELCSSGWLHCYSSPLLAVLLSPAHANFINPRLFIAETIGRGKHDHGLKSGYKKMRLIKEIELPEITRTQRIAFGILCAKEVYKDATWNKWADNWLNGTDRSAYAATYARADAYAARADAYAYADARAARADAYADAYAAYAAYSAADAAYADAYSAADAAYSAADAAAAAANAVHIDLRKIAQEAVNKQWEANDDCKY